MQEKSQTPKQGNSSQSVPAELRHLVGSNPVLSYMIQKGYPLTKEIYVDINWGDELPEEIDGEEQEVLDLLDRLS